MKRLSSVVLGGLLALAGAGAIGACQAVLVLDQQCNESSSYFPLALDNLGYDYTRVASREEFATALSEGGPWDLIVVDEYLSRLSADTLTALSAYVTAGGHLYVNYWDWDEALAATLGAVMMSDSEYWEPLPIYAWDPAHPLFTTPNALVSLVPANDTCDVDGAKFGAAAGSVALAGYTVSVAAGEAALIIGNEGRTVLFGGIIGLFSGDENGDGREDGLEFAENVVTYFLSPVESPAVLSWIPYVRMTPEYDNIVTILGFRPDETQTLDPAELATLLVDYSVLVIPEQQQTDEGMLENLGQATAAVLSDFLARGGRIVGMTFAKGADDILRGAGLWTVSDDYNVTGATLGVAAPGDSLARGVPAEYEGSDGSTDFQGLPEDATVVVWDTYDEAPVVFRWETLGGTIVMLGFDAYAYTCATATLLCNAVGVPVPAALRCGPTSTPSPCPICDGKVYTYGVWRVQNVDDTLYIVPESGALGFEFWDASNGWFYVMDGSQGYIVWSIGSVEDWDALELPIQEIMTAVPAGAVPEKLFTFGNWDVMFSAQGMTLMNAEDVASSDSYGGITISKTVATAVFKGRTTVTLFPQPDDVEPGSGCVCEPLYTDLSADEVEGVLDEMGFSYEREERVSFPVWYVTMDPGVVATVLFSNTTAGRYAGLQFVFYAFDIPAGAETIARWNREYRGSRAYIDEDGDAVLEAELYLAGGVSRKVISESISRFELSVGEFLRVLKGE